MGRLDRRKVDVALSTVLITASLIILTNDNLVEGGAVTELGSMFLPRIVSVVMIVFSAIIGIQSLRKLIRNKKIDASEKIVTEGFWGVYIYIGIFVAYWLLVPHMGFLVTTPFVMLSVALLLGGRNWLSIVSMSVITPILIFYGSREFLRVYLPTWTLF